MFIVEITPEARAEIIKQFKRGVFARPGLMIERKGPKAELTRSSDGTAKWQIERPYPLRARVLDLQPFEECLGGAPLVDGILVWLKSAQRHPDERGVKVGLHDGQLFVEPRAA